LGFYTRQGGRSTNTGTNGESNHDDADAQPRHIRHALTILVTAGLAIAHNEATPPQRGGEDESDGRRRQREVRTMRTLRRTSIDDLPTIGRQRVEEHLHLATGGRMPRSQWHTRFLGRPVTVYDD
jgi:hypothetical protein